MLINSGDLPIFFLLLINLVMAIVKKENKDIYKRFFDYLSDQFHLIIQ